VVARIPVLGQRLLQVLGVFLEVADPLVCLVPQLVHFLDFFAGSNRFGLGSPL
jgi:hypothetical protein